MILLDKEAILSDNKAMKTYIIYKITNTVNA